VARAAVIAEGQQQRRRPWRYWEASRAITVARTAARTEGQQQRRRPWRASRVNKHQAPHHQAVCATGDRLQLVGCHRGSHQVRSCHQQQDVVVMRRWWAGHMPRSSVPAAPRPRGSPRGTSSIELV